MTSPENGTISITVGGAAQLVNRLSAGDVQVILDVSNITPGSYVLPLRVTLPKYISLIAADELRASVTLRKHPRRRRPNRLTEMSRQLMNLTKEPNLAATIAIPNRARDLRRETGPRQVEAAMKTQGMAMSGEAARSGWRAR